MKPEIPLEPSGSLPTIIYHNKKGGHSCLLMALCSLLDYLGFRWEARQINKIAQPGLEVETSNVNCVNKLMKVAVNDHLQASGLAMTKNGKGNRYDPLNTTIGEVCAQRKTKLVLAKLKGRTGGINYAVAFVNDSFIFDSNYAVALPLTAKNLDLVCDGVGYCSLYWSYSLQGKGLEAE